MEKQFSSNEVVEMALDIERNGMEFYDHLSKNFEDPGKRELFSYLASQEAQHVKDFKILSEVLAEETDVEFWEEAEKYLKSVVEDRIFPKAPEMIARAKTMQLREIVNFAIGIEKETIIFYEEILDGVKAERSKEILRKIIHEEVGHVKTLLTLR